MKIDGRSSPRQPAEPTTARAATILFEKPVIEGLPGSDRAISENLAQALRAAAHLPSYSTPEPLDLDALQKLNAVIEQENAELPHSYHNGAHMLRVRKSFDILLTECKADLLEKTERSLPAEQQRALVEERIELARLAINLHDFGHCGARFRPEQLDPEKGTTARSNEEWAAYQGDVRAAGILTPRQRLILQDLILSTSFGQSMSADIADHLKRPYSATTKLARVVCLADTGGFLVDPETQLNSSLAVLEEGKIRPSSYEAFCEQERGFGGYLSRELERAITHHQLFPPEGAARVRSKLQSYLDRAESWWLDQEVRDRYNIIVAKMKSE